MGWPVSGDLDAAAVGLVVALAGLVQVVSEAAKRAMPSLSVGGSAAREQEARLVELGQRVALAEAAIDRAIQDRQRLEHELHHIREQAADGVRDAGRAAAGVAVIQAMLARSADR